MSRYARWIVCSVMMMAGVTASASAQEACDRACLRTMLDQYLNAVIKHDPSAVPLVVGFRQTENAINVRPGNGVNQRSDRATLVRIVNSYFDAITSHDNSVAMTHQGCGRVENGSPAPAGRFLPPTARNVFSEWFVIDEAKIRTAMFYPSPELAVPNWPPYEGNWPLPAGIVPAPASPRQP